MFTSPGLLICKIADFSPLTFVVYLKIIKIEICLPVAKDEGQEGEDEGVQDAHDGQHIGPAYRAIAQ